MAGDPIRADRSTLRLSLSTGAAPVVPDHPVEHVVTCADLALPEAGAAGCNRAVLHTGDR